MKRFSGLAWPVLLLALLAVLAWLQFHWTGQISVAERERMHASLESSVHRFTRDLDEEIATLFQAFRIDDPEDLATRLERHRDEARYPELVRTVYFYRPDGGLAELDPASTSNPLAGVDWPEELARVREQLSARPVRGRRSRPPLPFPVLTGDSLVVAVPVGSRERRRPGFPVAGLALVVLDPKTFRETVLPELAERHFGSDYDVAVVDGGGTVWFATDDGAAALARPDARGDLFSPGRFAGRLPSNRGDRRRRPRPEIAGARESPDASPWQVVARHRAGSLEAFVASTRSRNLVVSFGILGILGASVALVAVSTRRATELNDRKMEFIAGVSHELRTPVAVLRSAGQNLAHGSVADPEKVKRYGALIESEGRRLDDLVEQVLELAGIQSQNRRLVREPVPVDALVSGALADCERLREERGVPISTRLPSSPASVSGDPSAMRRALGNIIMNAIKHGGDDNAIEILAERRGSKMAIAVTDRGPGIPEEDQRQLFEPFYRGRRALDRQVPGSGLGLSLVDSIAREHGGSVEVESTLGKGSRFTLYLPAGD